MGGGVICNVKCDHNNNGLCTFLMSITDDAVLNTDGIDCRGWHYDEDLHEGEAVLVETDDRMDGLPYELVYDTEKDSVYATQESTEIVLGFNHTGNDADFVPLCKSTNMLEIVKEAQRLVLEEDVEDLSIIVVQSFIINVRRGEE